MNKVYARTNWENYPSENTPLNETNLNKMDYALNEIDDRVIELDKTKVSSASISSNIKSWSMDKTTGVITIEKYSGETETYSTIEELIEAVVEHEKSIEELNDKKITKFYASSLGDTTLTDSDNGKVQDMMLYGKSEQKQYSGYNLLYKTLSTTTSNGVTCTNNGDGTYTLNGTATAYCSFGIDRTHDITTLVEGKTYRLVGADIKNANYTNVIIYERAVPKSYIDKGEGVSFVYNTENKPEVVIQVYADRTVNNVIIKPMIVDAELYPDVTYDDYEPYVGGIPSPNPDYPQEIKSVVNPVVTLSDSGGTNSKSASLPYTLNAIPVSSGGNVTIDGQEYIADYVDVERGKIVSLIDEINGADEKWSLIDSSGIRRFYIFDKTRFDLPYNTAMYSERFTQVAYNSAVDLSMWFQQYYIVITDINNKWENVDELKSWLAENNVHFYINRVTPIEIDLTDEEIQAFKELTTYYPTTNVFVTSDELDGYTVFNYPINMKNGWDYVKQQIGDTREYIYDMEVSVLENRIDTAILTAMMEG